MDESILNHLFLPHYLPNAADNDFLIRGKHENEYKLLECLDEFFNSISAIHAMITLPIFRILHDCIKRWSILQNPQNLSVLNIQSTIEKLSVGSFLPLYFHTQNAAILIEIDEKYNDQPIVSAWEVLLPTLEITSSFTRHYSCFPVATYRLCDRSKLISKAHCEVLIDFMSNTIEYSKAQKSSREVDEIRDVSESHYVCQWWIQQFQGITVDNTAETCFQFKKKHRDQIRLKNGLSPFRRSGLWMTVKVVIHTILMKYLKENGTIVYKLFITHFLAYIISTRTASIELLIHGIRKIVRRLNKIDNLLVHSASQDINQWIENTKKDIQSQINQLISKPDWQEIIRMNEIRNENLLDNNFQLDNTKICKHSCEKLKDYLNNNDVNEASGTNLGANNSCGYVSQTINKIDYMPSLDTLTKKYKYTIGIALTRLEIWVETRLEQWINRGRMGRNEKNFGDLLEFFEEYQDAALAHYWSNNNPTDPVGYTRFILTSLTIIYFIHKKLCQDEKFKRLSEHSVEIPHLMNLFEFLVLPNREDMIRAKHLYDYFNEFISKPYPDLLTNIKHSNTFGVHYAGQSSAMNSSIEQIRKQAEIDKRQKIQEVTQAKERYTRLMNSIRGLSCSCQYTKYGSLIQCPKCRTEAEAMSIRVRIFECPMPVERESALAVIFELQMPSEIRCYREILWQFVNRPQPKQENKMHVWLKVSPHQTKLKSFYYGPENCKVNLVSSTTSTTETHFSHPPSIASTPVEDFLFENSLKVQISPTNPIEFDAECRILTPQLDHADYKSLQFTINSTRFVQNDVIAKLSDCSLQIKTKEFVEFGSFRSGHRLQWWNLLTVLEMDSLSIAEESVAILITHSILQYGPVTIDGNISMNFWCSESHEQLLQDHFIDELTSRLNRHLDDCELNWQNELVLIVITMITVRILTICNSTREHEVVNLVMKCRKTGEKWIQLISTSMQTIAPSAFQEMAKLRQKMVIIGITSLLTFSTHQDRIRYLLSSNEHVISLLKAATTVHDNIILSKDQSNLSIFMRNIMRMKERILVMIHPTLTEFLERTSYESLNEFSAIYWAVIRSKGSINGNWRKRINDPHDGWYDGQYGTRLLSIDCIQGTFLVDDMTVGFLPEKITSNELFVRVFGSHIFEVQAAESPNTYISKHSHHGDGRVQYEFYFNEEKKHLTINERHIKTHDMFQLVPHHCFKTELADTFVSSHSHWYNAKSKILEFRPIQFQNEKFLDDKPYVLKMDTGFIITTDMITPQMLINRSSTFFRVLFNQYFNRLDDHPYVYMMREADSQLNIIIHIHLSRLGIAFQYNNRKNIITSREYSDMCIDKDQWLGTLTGLSSGLLLSPLAANNYRLENYPYRKLLVPFGILRSTNTLSTEHQSVIVDRTSFSNGFLQHYFVFILNDRLKIVQSTDSPTGWLYLALLHAMTSHPLPDQYTRMTGMERAFQLLKSAGCCSDQPFDALSLDILIQIASITPKVRYYPEKVEFMETIDWNSNGLPYSMQHFGYYLIVKKIIQSSQRFNFMYSSSSEAKLPELFDGKKYNEKLLKKLYLNYRDSYNPMAKLPQEMEADIILHTYSVVPHQPCIEQCSYMTAYCPADLVGDLYNSGNVNLVDHLIQNWLPLSQWLSKGCNLRDIWIGLLTLADRLKAQAVGNNTDDIQRFECLLDFLYYISNKYQIKPFYLQLLKTQLKATNISLRSVAIPPFINYQNIEEFFFNANRMSFINYYNENKRHRIISEVQNCFTQNCSFWNTNQLLTSTEADQINQLLTSSQNNKKLRSFLETLRNLFYSVQIEQFDTKVSYISQQFACESCQDHYQIRLNPSNKSIDQDLLSKAEAKFHHFYQGHFDKSLKPSRSIIRQQGDEFPEEIFSSINGKGNALSEIGNYFKNQLSKSWENFLRDKPVPQKGPSVEEFIELLKLFSEESTQSWKLLEESLTTSNEQLFQSGLTSRITPTTLIPLLQQNIDILTLNTEQRTLLGGILVNWTLQQQLERALHFANHEQWDEFRKEISTTPHSNWKPVEYIPWLIFELEMNITIREIQINVAQHMMQMNINKPNNSIAKSLVMQMNMGEGKTSVILPMLALSLSSSNSTLIRIVVLKSLFPTNYQSLRYKLGGLLNRRVFPFACRRDMNFSNEQIALIFNRFKEGLDNCDVILISPEDILSFDLLTLDKCRRQEYDVSRSMLTMQRWLKQYARDVLDESDEILHVKYQLIYTVGGQQQVDGGAERWKTIQTILALVKNHAQDIATDFDEEVCYKPSERKSSFPQFRLQSHQPFPSLCEKIANDWLNNRPYRESEREDIRAFILQTDLCVDKYLEEYSPLTIQLFLIVRGLLSSEVLLVALKKRYRVNYGINPNPSFRRLLAVPYRAKDVAADRTEFGHPDVALVLTHLTYYYSGLNESQLTQCFDRLNDHENDPASIYDQWITFEDTDDIPISIQQWRGVNLKDYQQRTKLLFPTLRCNMLVVNYFLDYFVFPREAKQFPHKLVSSAWDLSSSARSKIITGFSGTNDTQLLLPIHIRQDDLPELQKTDAIVVNNLLKVENENYQSLTINASTDEILNQLINQKLAINVILDVGALFIDGSNQTIAMRWLNLSDKNQIDYAVYFDSDSIFVCDRHNHHHHHRFETSPASERLDRCIFYLDDVHTRGTDFKFPKGFRAAVTLGNGLTKDRFVQACMRMRKLGNGHSLTFWSSHEVHQQIKILKKCSLVNNDTVDLIDILCWVYENTQHSIWDGLHHWASQSLSFQRKMSAFEAIDWNNYQQVFTDTMMKELAEACLEPEIIELIRMYGSPKELQTVFNMYFLRYTCTNHALSREIQQSVLKRLKDYGGTKQRLAQLLDEEQQRELEQELEEERQLQRPSPVNPCQPILHEEIKKLCELNEVMDIANLPRVFRSLTYAFTDTTLAKNCQPNSWLSNIWVSTEFQRVIATKGESLNPFLRPSRWIVVYRNQEIIFLSPFEANWLMGRLKLNESSTTTLRLLLPRTKRIQSIFVNAPNLTIPPSIKLFNENIATFFIPNEWLVQLFIFNGTIYFGNVDEQTAFCQCLSLCPKPRTQEEEEAFEKSWISSDSFVTDIEHRCILQLNQARFRLNPLEFIKEVIENRNNSHATVTSHVGSIILNSTKLL